MKRRSNCWHSDENRDSNLFQRRTFPDRRQKRLCRLLCVEKTSEHIIDPHHMSSTVFFSGAVAFQPWHSFFFSFIQITASV